MKSKLQRLRIDVFIFLLIGFSFNFFSPKFLQDAPIGVFRFLFVSIAIFLSLPYLFDRESGLGKPVRWLFLAQVVSIVMAYFSWGQDTLTSLRAPVPYMLWIFIFYLIRINYPMEKIEKMMMFFGCLYVLFFFYQFTHSDTVIFGEGEEFREERGVTRIPFPGTGIFLLAAYISLNKLTVVSRHRLFYIFFSIAALVVTTLQVTRQNIVLLLLIYVFHFTRKMSVITKTIAISLIAFAGFFLITSDIAIVKGLTEAQQDTNSAGANYIRVKEANYFLFDFSPDIYARVLGNGVPYRAADEESNYGKTVFNLKQFEGYFFSDVGIIGVYAMFGLIAVFAYIVLFVKSFKIKVPEEYLYLKYYLFYIALTCFTSDGLYSPNFLIADIFVFYGLHRFYRKRQVPVQNLAFTQETILT